MTRTSVAVFCPYCEDQIDATVLGTRADYEVELDHHCVAADERGISEDVLEATLTEQVVVALDSYDPRDERED